MNYRGGLLEHPKFQELIEEIHEGKKNIYLHGLVSESTGHLLFSLYEKEKRPVFVLCENAVRAKELALSISEWEEGLGEFFPEDDYRFFDAAMVEDEKQQERLRILTRLANGETPIITTTLQALQKKISGPEVFGSGQVRLYEGKDLPPEDLVKRLLFLGYDQVSIVEAKGEFALRGGILDIFPPALDQPVRVEFFDTEIDSIRNFEVSDQRSVDRLDEVFIGPSKELLLSEEEISRVEKELRKDYEKSWKKAKNPLTKEQLEERFLPILDGLSEGVLPSNPDWIRPYVDGVTLLDYFPDNLLLVIEDLNRIDANTMMTERFFLESSKERLERGEILPSHIKLYHKMEDFLGFFEKYTVVHLSALLKQLRHVRPDALIQLKTREVENFQGQMDVLALTLKRRKVNHQKTVLFVPKESNAELLQSQLRDHGLIADREGGEVQIALGNLSKGFEYPEIDLAFYGYPDLFGTSGKKIRRKKKSKKDLLSYEDLDVGDYVVHENYGIGRYQGLVTRTIAGSKKDYLLIDYRNKDRLYVPTDGMALISKYIGSEGKAPTLSRLGGTDWARTKSRAKKAVEEIATEIVELYRERAKIKGYAFSEDTPWQKEFEDAFPFEETPSQIEATEEIKKDMEQPVPMDRLLCGDVGYGKTEVAFRAAFKAIMDGKQVAFLVPTTILCQQHYQTAVDRFKVFPVNIEFLSRFKTKAEQKDVVKRLKEGKIDLIIGTHRLLSKDIKFKDLGLLILDEEQRFGVKDKEKMKMLKKNLDVLTLSATPIPRTLQMSLTGIREMSILTEPPQRRSPITTFVSEYDPLLVRDAILKEVSRNGQCYFIFNRVKTMHIMWARLQELIPEVRIEMVHGQMTTNQLEKVMIDFTQGEIDVLLTTTIIETGMDIQNVNTMILYDADRLGLSQLYQLKGRIGRGIRSSYAYFMYEQGKVLTEVAEKRLKAIRDFTDFGSGYKIAMRDLELRGAGNLLGESQSGHIESVGYDLYVKLLEQAVSEKKGIEAEETKDIPMEIPIEGYIPSDYIADQGEKIRMYKKIANIDNQEEYDRIVEEFIDRFGDPPKPVTNIMDIALLKATAARLGFTKVKQEEEDVSLYYPDFSMIPLESLEFISRKYTGELKYDFSSEMPRFIVPADDRKLDSLKKLLSVVSTTIGGKHEF